jgi:putative membrane protein
MSDVKIERLSRYLFSAPSWQRSIGIILVLGLVIDGASFRTDQWLLFFGTMGYIIPALAGFLLTMPLVQISGKHIKKNRSAMLAMACMVFGIIISLSPILFVVEGIFSVLYSISLGVIFAIRLLVLTAIVDYRISKMVPAALTQSLVATFTASFFFDAPFILFSLLMHLVFGGAILLFIWLVELPLKRNFNISALNFMNAFIAHITDGSKTLDDYFREIGEAVYVPQASLFFHRDGKERVIFTVPNVHPGPMGEVGGGNLPKILHDGMGGNTLVAHGCATHDFNLVSEMEIPKIVDAVRTSHLNLPYHTTATKARRYEVESVQVLAQVFGDSILLVSTRSPEKTEDLDYSIGLAIMFEGRRHFENVLFVDAHNCMVDVTDPVMPASPIAYEYMRACAMATEASKHEEQHAARVGFSHQLLPFSREEGFGDLGLQVMVVRVGGQYTAYVLFDGNNMQSGVRETIRDRILELVDECEIMTTDSHVVNTISGKNPVGFRVPAEQILPFVEEAVKCAMEDCSSAEVAGSTAWCEDIVVFGSHRVSQLASTVNGMLSLLLPVALSILIFAFLLSFVAYFVIV